MVDPVENQKSKSFLVLFFKKEQNFFFEKKKQKTFASLGALLLVAAWPSRAEVRPADGGMSIGAGYVDAVQLPTMAGWQRVSHTATADEAVDEFVPEGESAADWSQIITVKAMKLTRDPRAVVAGAVAVMRSICGSLPVINTARRQEIGNAAPGGPVPIFDAAETLVTCKDPDVLALRQRAGTDRVTLRRHEVTWYKMMWGPQANYIVQRAWHGDEIDDRSVLGSHDVLQVWKNWITQVTLGRVPAGSGQK